MGKQRINLTGQLKEWLAKMVSDILAVWIEPFRLMELAESGINTSIPGPPPDLRGEGYGGESQSRCILHDKTIGT
jgi:hypothetical protein